MLLHTEPVLSSRMPAFVVSEEMRQRIDALAETTGLSRGEIMRRALSLFFAEITNEITESANLERIKS